MKKSIYIIALVVLTLVGCDYDKAEHYTILPDIEIEDVSATGKLPSTIFVGETLRIEPEVTYGNQGAEAFDFRWYKQLSNSLELLSDQSVFEHVMDSLGYWTIRLEVTNKETQISASSTMGINVISRSERGWYILKETPDGNTDMDMFRVTEEGNDDGSDTDLLADKGVVLHGKPATLLYTYNYSWKEEWESYFTTYISTFIPVSEFDVASMRINDGRIFYQTDQMFYDAGDQLTNGQSGIGVVSQQMLINDGKAHLMQAGMQAFLPVIPGNYRLSPWVTSSLANSSSNNSSHILAFDELSSSFVYIVSLASSLYTFPDKYVTEQCQISSNQMNGTISFMENTDGSVNDSIPLYGQRAYALFHENDRTDRCLLLGLDLAQVDPQESEHGGAQYSPVMYADTLYYADQPLFREAEVMTLHKTYPLLYMAKGNQLSCYDISAKRMRENILTFPAGESVSYMHYVGVNYDSVTIDELLIATVTSAGNYKVYRYKIAGDDIRQTGSVYEGKGKVKTMMFASPNSSSWEYQLYRYY